MNHQRFVMFGAMQTGSPERAAKSSVNILELLGSLHAVGDGGVIPPCKPSWTLLDTDQCF